MKKILSKIFVIIWLFLASFWSIFASSSKDYLDQLHEKRDIIIWNDTWDFLVRIADSLVIIFFIIAVPYFFIIVIKLIMNENSEEEATNFKKWIIWISIWLWLMKFAQAFVYSTRSKEYFAQRENSWSILENAANMINYIITPLTNLLVNAAAIIFVLIAIFAFYKLITSNWDDATAKSGKMMVWYAIIWFIIIKIAQPLISAVYWSCTTLTRIINPQCELKPNISAVPGLASNIINWINSFIWVWLIVMIVYIWFKVIFSNWDSEKLNEAKKSITYILIWVGILVVNYFILTFFLRVN